VKLKTKEVGFTLFAGRSAKKLQQLDENEICLHII
jgi:hypothetical protein